MLNKFLEQLQADTHNTIKLGLNNISAAAKTLRLNKPAPYVVTIAGTNGKGSVINLLDNLLVNLGFKTGCYTSPHLIKFNERIKINRQDISDYELLTSFEFISKQLQQNNLKLTFFEIITLTAWWIFQTKKLDIILLEIGLGGRLDAVNVIPKDLAIITSIDYDHQSYLGNTLEAIGYEKAGIITTENLPVILGDNNIPQIVSEIAIAKKAKIYQYGVDYGHSTELCNNLNIRQNNIATSLKALDIIFSCPQQCLKTYSQEIINQTVKNFNLVGRCSWLDKDKSILIDVAHNKQSINNLKNYLINNQDTKNKQIVAVFGMLADKDIAQCLAVINPIISHWYLASINEPRGVRAEEIAGILLTIGNGDQAGYSCYDNIINCYQTAYNFIKQNTNKNSILVVFGSFHIVGPVCENYNAYMN